MQWVRLSLFTGDVVCPCHGTQYPMNPSPFRGISILAPALVNDVYREFASASHTIHPSPAPRDARRYALASRPQRQPHGCGYIVRGQSTGRYLPASPPRVLMMGHQVRSWCIPCQTIIQATSCRTLRNEFARFDHYRTRKCIPLRKLRREIQ